MKRALTVLLLLISGAPTLAVTLYVRPAGSDSLCNGLIDQDRSAPVEPNCAFATIDKAEQTAPVASTIQVATGSYAECMRPVASPASDAQRLTYLCAGICNVSPANSTCDGLDEGMVNFTNKSYISITATSASNYWNFSNGEVNGWGGSSTGNVIDRFRMSGFLGPSSGDPDGGGVVKFKGAGGMNNTVRNLIYDATRVDTLSPPSLAISIGESAETGTTVGPVRMFAGGPGLNGLGIARCTNCLIDGSGGDFVGLLGGSDNHNFEIGGTGPVVSLTVQNYVIGSSHYLENGLQALVASGGLSGTTTIRNCLIFGGLDLPNVGHETSMSGTGIIKNNVLVCRNQGSSSPCFGLNNDTAVTWEIGNNALLGSGNLSGTARQWLADTRGATNTSYYIDPDGDGTCTDNDSGNDLTEAAAIFGTIIPIDDSDWSTVVKSCAGKAYGVNGPTWAVEAEPGGGCTTDTNSFDGHNEWSEGIALNHRVEHKFDGVSRLISARNVGGGCAGTAVRYDVNPDVGSTIPEGSWFLDWGLVGATTAKTYVPDATSSLRDGGSDADCGHTIVGAHCDLGPVEFDSGTPPQPPAAGVGIKGATAVRGMVKRP